MEPDTNPDPLTVRAKDAADLGALVCEIETMYGIGLLAPPPFAPVPDDFPPQPARNAITPSHNRQGSNRNFFMIDEVYQARAFIR